MYIFIYEKKEVKKRQTKTRRPRKRKASIGIFDADQVYVCKYNKLSIILQTTNMLFKKKRDVCCAKKKENAICTTIPNSSRMIVCMVVQVYGGKEGTPVHSYYDSVNINM